MKPSFLEVIRYRFDKIMSAGVVALIGLLAIVSFIFIALVAMVVVLFGLFPPGQKFEFFEVLWFGVLRALDPGTMGQDVGLGFRASMFVVTIAGVIVVAGLIGVISNAFSERVEQLRKGRSKVLEKDHVLILGWSGKIHQVVHEITMANQSKRPSVVVILADRDKVAMEEELRTRGQLNFPQSHQV